MTSLEEALRRTLIYLRHFQSQFKCDITQVTEYDTHFVVIYRAEWINHPDEMPIVNLWLIVDKPTGRVYFARGPRTQRSDLDNYPANQDSLPSVDLSEIDGQK